MWTNDYLDHQVLTADPLELVRILYREAIRSVQDARASLAAKDIAARGKAITRAQAIVAELQGSLDLNAGGEISRNLGELYDYIRQRLTIANVQQQDGPLAEAEALISELYEAWRRIGEPHSEASPFTPPLYDAAPASGGSHLWTA